MKKVLLFFAMLSVVTVSAQDWNESTQDAAFEAPNSVLTSTKWVTTGNLTASNPIGEYTFRSNGTLSWRQLMKKDAFTIEVTSTGTWRRSKGQLTIVVNLFALNGRLMNSEEFSARRQDEANSLIIQLKNVMIQTYGTSMTTRYELLRLDSDHLIIAAYKGNLYDDLRPERFVSSEKKERDEKLAEERRLAEQKAAEKRLLAEQKAAEELRLAKEKEKQLRLAEYEKLLAEYKPGDNIRPFIVNGVPFKMVLVEGGTFQMGATEEQGRDADSDETPAFKVKLSDYMIGETEVTQELWEAVMGSNPSEYKGEMNPVEQVSWNDCKTFIEKLNSLTGQNFRLPTEAEWEFAARGGKKSLKTKYSGSNTLGDVAWFNGSTGSHPVATKQKNELGLYDMSGNVSEWCEDWMGEYTASILVVTAKKNPKGPSMGSNRVIRGGSWYYNAGTCRVSSRDCSAPANRYNKVGFRLAL